MRYTTDVNITSRFEFQKPFQFEYLERYEWTILAADKALLSCYFATPVSSRIAMVETWEVEN